MGGGSEYVCGGCVMCNLFGGGRRAAFCGIKGDVSATDNNIGGMGVARLKSAKKDHMAHNHDEAVPSLYSRALAKVTKGLLESTTQANTDKEVRKLQA